MKIYLTATERQHLRSLAHPLKPVVTIGHRGVNAAVLREIDVNLTAHELIKIRACNGERATRNQLLEQLCEQLNTAPVQLIGKLFIVWRPSDKQKVVLPTR